jgi:single-strand DNA-binding protein
MSLEVTGKLYEVFEENQVSDKFRKREFVIEIADGSYTQYPKFQLTQDKCSLIDNFKVGQEIKILFNLTCKPFMGKDGKAQYFTNLQAWKIDSEGTQGSARQDAPSAWTASKNTSDDEENDLPF